MILDSVSSASEEQSRAVHHVPGSRDFMISFKGPAGAGKTELMIEAVTAIESLSGKRVVVLAPSSPSVEVLRAQGFTNASTLQQFQVSSELQKTANGECRTIAGAVRQALKKNGLTSDAEPQPVFRRQRDSLPLLAAWDRRHHRAEVAGFLHRVCAHRATCLKADGKDITHLKLMLDGIKGNSKNLPEDRTSLRPLKPRDLSYGNCS